MKNRNQEAALVLLGGILLAVIAIGQEKRQEWTLKPGRTPGNLHLSIEMHKPRQHWTHSTDVPADRFAGLSPDPFSHTGPAKFEYVQDAGKFLTKLVKAILATCKFAASGEPEQSSFYCFFLPV